MPATNFWGDTDQETCGPWTGKWLVHTIGDASESGEISIVREDFKHGFRSLGWEGPAKYIIKKWNQNASQQVWDAMIEMAKMFAEELNKLDIRKQ